MHTSSRLYAEEFDFPHRAEPPRVTYMLATIPRSGSTYFSLKLWQTGCLGAPLEYPSVELIETTGIRERLDCAEFPSFWQKIKTVRTSPNGVFGYKMFRPQFKLIGRKYPQILDDITPTYVVYLTRENLAAQAISYSRAIRSKVWFADVPIPDETKYDPEHIDFCEDLIVTQKDFWERVFETTGAKVHRVSYESFCEQPDETIADVARFMGVPITGHTLPIPVMNRQRDAKSEEWESRYAQTRCAAQAGARPS